MSPDTQATRIVPLGGRQAADVKHISDIASSREGRVEGLHMLESIIDSLSAAFPDSRAPPRQKPAAYFRRESCEYPARCNRDRGAPA